MSIESKILPSQTLDSVSRCGFAHFACNRHAEATALKIVFTDICDEILVLDALAVLPQALIIISLKQSVAFGKSCSRGSIRLFSVLLNASRFFGRYPAGPGTCFVTDYRARRLRPLARRRLMMRRPALVAILERKPWVLALLILLG